MSNRRKPRRVVPLRPVASWAASSHKGLPKPEELADEMRRGLEKCTGQPDCPNSVHWPSCWAAR